MSRLLFLGDFFYDYSSTLTDIEEIAEWIKQNEYKVILNLEGPITNNGSKIKKRGPNLKQSSITINILKKLNVIGVCLANNHIMDFGEEGLLETIKILDENNIPHTGAGVNIKSALKPIVINVENQKVIIQNFGWDLEETVYATQKSSGCAPRDEKIVIERTKEIRKNNNDALIINVFHWGYEYNLYPMPLDIDLAHKSIDVGTDLIIGHHPHNIQPFEKYKGKEIYYSLGNFYFGSDRSSFQNIEFRHTVKNMCDYGLAVAYDTLLRKTVQTFTIYYDLDGDCSGVLKDSTIYNFFDEITGVKYDKPEYFKKVKENSLNKKPILTLNYQRNKYEIAKLQTIHFIKRILRPIKRKFLNN